MSDPAAYEFSVVIATRGRPQQLASTVAAIAQTNFPHEAVEIVVSADGKGQRLEEAVGSANGNIAIRLVEQDHQGPGAARNAGAAAARGRYIAFTDDDCRPSAEWLPALKEALDRSPSALIGGRTVNALEENVYAEASQLIHQVVYGHYNRDPDKATFLATNNMALRADGFAAVGGFDPSFRLASEDREFCDRWLWKGWPMRYEEKALVRHAHLLTLGGFCRQHFRYGRGAARYHRLRAQRGSGKLRDHLSFHRNLSNWLWPHVEGGLIRQAQIRSLLFGWQGCNAAGFFWENLR